MRGHRLTSVPKTCSNRYSLPYDCYDITSLRRDTFFGLAVQVEDRRFTIQISVGYEILNAEVQDKIWQAIAIEILAGQMQGSVLLPSPPDIRAISITESQ